MSNAPASASEWFDFGDNNMSVTDWLYGMVKDKAKETFMPEGGILDRASGFLSDIFKKNPELEEKAKEIQEKASREREDIFAGLWNTGGEFAESWLNRTFPTFSKWLNIAGLATGMKEEEDVPWQHEFETLTSLTLFIPDFLLRYATDFLSGSETFMKLVESWPACDEIAEKIRYEDDPDDVISALRIINQDIITGKVSGEGLWKHVISAFISR